MWNKKKIENHIKVAKLLDRVKDKAFGYIGKNRKCSEYEVQEFILGEFKKSKLKTDGPHCIVAFRQNTSYVHYFPSQYCLRLRPESLIMIDIWGKLGIEESPYADITWMAYCGKKVPSEINKAFFIVLKARDEVIRLLRTSLRNGILPTGKALDAAARDYISLKDMSKYFFHTTGHSLGVDIVHGSNGGLGAKNKRRLIKNLGYTIEPGVYNKNKFGIRSEINFYIDNRLRLVVTTRKQNSIVLI